MGNVLPNFCLILELVHKPVEKIKATVISKCHGQVERGLVYWIDHMPPASWKIKHASILKNVVPDRFLGWLFGAFYIFFVSERIQAGWSINSPMLTPRDLKDYRIVVVIMEQKSVVRSPASVQVRLNIDPEDAFHLGGQLAHWFIQIFKGIYNECRSLREK